MHLIQLGLDEVITERNGHRTRASHNTCVPAGIPDQLFFLPPSGKYFIILYILPLYAEVGHRDFISPFHSSDLSTLDQNTEKPDAPAPLEFLETALYILHQLYIHTNDYKTVLECLNTNLSHRRHQLPFVALLQQYKCMHNALCV